MRHVLITGAAGALGSAVARRLASEGSRSHIEKVSLLDVPQQRERLAALTHEVGGRNFVCDLSSEIEVSRVMRDVTDGGAPTYAVLVAGGWRGGVPLHEGGAGDYHDMFRMNVNTVYFALRAMLPLMVAAKGGSVVVIGSRAVERPWTSAGAAAYAASKSAVVALAQTLAQEVLPFGVRVNAIMPSTLDTPANRKAMPDADPSRWVSLESCAGVIDFLLSDDSRDISGASIPVYGRV
jgi:NAD(P)-dependent dehydrogenase (short-subunit alcohol dehydrogenase family)